MTASATSSKRGYRCCAALLCMVILTGTNTFAQIPLPNAKPIPQLQVAPQPQSQILFERDGRELTRYHFGSSLRRPFWFPVLGPAGRSLTRLGNIRDPQGHRHHDSIWISHHDVNGVNFWSNTGDGRIVHRRTIHLDDGDDVAVVETENEWVEGSDQVLLRELRQVDVLPLTDQQWLLIVQLQLEPVEETATLGKTPFGLMGVRVASSLSVQDGGGMIRNSERAENEKAIIGNRARWVDYSGPIKQEAAEGITLMDHPANPRHPTKFHVRNDGWMGASLTFDDPFTIERESPLQLCYGLLIHRGVPTHEQLEEFYRNFVEAAGEKK